MGVVLRVLSLSQNSYRNQLKGKKGLFGFVVSEISVVVTQPCGLGPVVLACGGRKHREVQEAKSRRVEAGVSISPSNILLPKGPTVSP